MAKTDFTIFRYSTLLALTRAGITTFAELEQMTNEDIQRLRGLGLRGYDEILAVLGRQDHDRQESKGEICDTDYHTRAVRTQ